MCLHVVVTKNNDTVSAFKTEKKLIIGFLPTNCTEQLVDCGWIDLNFHCIRQEGFECQTPVSDTVVVSMPSSFADKKGSYKCIPHGDGHDTARQCRYPMAEGKFHYFFLGVFMKPIASPYRLILQRQRRNSRYHKIFASCLAERDAWKYEE